MKILNYLSYFLIAICIAILVYLFVIKRKEYKIDGDFNESVSRRKLELAHNYYYLPDSLKLKDLSNNNIGFHQLIKSNTLIFRYSFLSCNSCVFEKLHVLDSIYNMGYKNILILAHYDDLRSVLIDYKTNHYKFPFYILENNLFIQNLDDIRIPQFYLISENFLINQIYFPGFSSELDDAFISQAIRFISK